MIRTGWTGAWALLVLGLLTACGERAPSGSQAQAVAAPLSGVANAYEAAGRTVLVPLEPEHPPELHHVYRLSENILSGGEPDGERGIERLVAYGVRTVISVDGQTPEVELAQRHGLRYVHIPLQYKGLKPDELLRLAKVFRELEPPFYVHCFHGVHRGPAAAAVGRLVLDGVSREQAIGEMRQYFGTSSKYEGLYQTVASAPMPSASSSASFEYEFPSEFRFGGFRQAMVGMSRHFDVLEALSKQGWAPMPDHPDLKPAAEAEQLAAATAQSLTCGDRLCADAATHDAEYDGWLHSTEQLSRQLAEDLGAVGRKEEGASARALATFEAVRALCAACHTKHRNSEAKPQATKPPGKRTAQ